MAVAVGAVQAGAATATAVLEARNLIWDPLKRMLAYSNDMDKIHKSMIDALAMLLAEKSDHQNKIQRHATKMSSRAYKEWIRKVEEIGSQVERLALRYTNENDRHKFILHKFVRASPRSRIREKMRKVGAEIFQLLEKSNQFRDDLLVDREPEKVVKKVGAPEIKGFPTLQEVLQKILVYLSNNKVRGIGVYGMVGIGKTTIMQNLNNDEKVADMFDIVIWVKVSTDDKKKNLSTEHLQEVLIKRLKLFVEGTNHVDEVAQIIRSELESKRYLILLDDVREDLDLNQIGIPLNNGKVESKIVLTTTPNKRHVYQRVVDRLVEVRKLSEKEAWDMFQTILDRPTLRQNRHIERVMRQVVKLGDRVPLMLEMVARCFRMRLTEESWNDGFRSLRFWPRKGDHPMKELYELLNFCYDNLNDAQKDCFLYSALYPEDSDIYTGGLLDSWEGENFLGGNDADVENVHAKARDILREFMIMLLLEEGTSKQYVRMHKWIRRAALYIMSIDDKCNNLVRTSEALQEPPEEEQWKQKNWISLVDNNLHSLPDKPDCSMLSTLFLQENSNLRKIPDSFFEHMENLRVLGLYGTGIASLPSSLSKLTNLKVLNLNGCTDLVEIPSQIGELQILEVLDIRGSGVKSVPPELPRVRRLLVSFAHATNKTNTHNEVIPQLSTLEELVFDVKVSKQIWSGMLCDVIKMAIALKKLNNLQLCFQDEDLDVIKVVQAILRISAPEANNICSFIETRDVLGSTLFQVFIGCSITSDPQIHEFFRYQRYVKYCNGEGIHISILELLAKADSLEIVNHIDLERLSDFGAPSLSGIKGCRMESCTKVRTIVDVNCTLHNSLILSNLKRLYLEDLVELQSIWAGPIHIDSLPKLKTLYLSRCPKLTKILSQSAVQKVIQDSHNAGLQPRVFPNMKELILVDMTNLTSIWENDSLEWPSLETLKISKCPALTSLPFSKDNALNLASIVTEQVWWEALQWTDHEVKEQLQLYFRFDNGEQ